MNFLFLQQRALLEQQEMRRQQKEQAERERLRQENERRREREEEDALDKVRKTVGDRSTRECHDRYIEGRRGQGHC